MARYPKMEFDQNIADEICALLIQGESLRSILARDGMPDAVVVFRWLSENPQFDKQYGRAREIYAELVFGEIFDIADDGRNDWMERKRKDGTVFMGCDHEHVQRSKLRVDTRKWALSKMLPKKYGDRIIHAGDENAPLTTKDLTAREQKALARALAARTGKPQTPAEDPPDDDYDDLC